MKENSKLIAVHEGKYYKRSDGLAVGPGCFTRGLEYATAKKAIVIGKPNPYFFNCAIPEGISPHECCMIGDVSVFFLHTPILYYCISLSQCVCLSLSVFFFYLSPSGIFITSRHSMIQQKKNSVYFPYSNHILELLNRSFMSHEL